ncbi:unnamed protein product [Closterium sp. NIES-54]
MLVTDMAAILPARHVTASPLCLAYSPPANLPASSARTSRHPRSARCLATNQEPPEGDRGSRAGGASGEGGASSAGWRVRPKVAGQAAISLATAGFVDAGYSGDWSRIGVITADTERTLQLAALGVVPLAALAIFLLWDRQSTS